MKDQLCVGFVGMDHLGITSATGAAEKGWRVICFDNRNERVAELNNGLVPFVEPGLKSAIKRNRHLMSFVVDPGELRNCDLVYIALDVPTDSTGLSDLQPIRNLVALVQKHLNDQALMINMCQVPPGFTRALSRPATTLYYQVETLIFGQALDRAVNPERIIIGCNNPCQELDNKFTKYLDSYSCPLFLMRYESAELAKISINLYLAASVSVANTMSELCEKLDADWGEISPTMKSDRRIGHHAYLKPGLGISGGNLERDLRSIVELANLYGTNADVVKSYISDSEYRKDWVLRCLLNAESEVTWALTIAVLGLSYKENTASTKNSASVALLSKISSQKKFQKIAVYDPIVRVDKIRVDNLVSSTTELEACQDADAVLIMTPWPQFSCLNPSSIAEVMKGNLIIDPHSMLSLAKCGDAGLVHYTLGRPPSISKRLV